MTPVLTTQRLNLQPFTLDDAPFILALLNEPSFLQFIGDRRVRTLEAARHYLRQGPIASYQKNGFGLYLTTLKENGAAIGMCGLIKREGLADVDIGYAFLPAYWGQGYATEAAAGVLAYGKTVIGLNRIVAITAVANDSSIKVLQRIGLRFERLLTLPGEDEEIMLFAWDRPSAATNQPS
jgi:RimJ/RimL family protein N-acetyltransferase